LRSPKSAHAYKEVWTARGSPLMSHSLDLRDALRARFAGSRLQVELAMRYGNPSIEAGFAALRECERVMVLPLFPQYSDSTNGSVHAEAARVALSRRDAPALCLLPPFPDDEGYIDALAQGVRLARQAATRMASTWTPRSTGRWTPAGSW
jgi:ferrochelatase